MPILGEFLGLPNSWDHHVPNAPGDDDQAGIWAKVRLWLALRLGVSGLGNEGAGSGCGGSAIRARGFEFER